MSCIDVSKMTDSEFLSFLYSEREREESLNSYKGWNLWAIYGAMITVACAIYNIICTHPDEINKLRTGYIVSGCLGVIFQYWYLILFIKSFFERKRAKDYKKIKYLKDVAPIPYIIVSFFCSFVFAIFFPIADMGNRWNIVSISWILMTVNYLLLGINVYVNKDTIVRSYIEDTLFSRVGLMIVTALSLNVIFWIIWRWSFSYVTGTFIGSPDFEIAVCLVAIVLLLYLLLKVVLANRKSSQIDVLLDEYLYKGKSKDDVYDQLRANLMGYGILEACSQDLGHLKRYYDDFENQKNKLEELMATDSNVFNDPDMIMEQINTLKKTLDYSDEWSKRVGILHDKLNEIKKNVSELKDEEEFINLLSIVGYMMSKTKVINDDVKSVTENLQTVITRMTNIDKDNP